MTTSTTPPAEWDRWLGQLGAAASFSQTACWATITEEVNGVRPLFVEVAASASSRAGALLGLRPARRSFAAALLPTTNGPFVECLGGPAFTGEPSHVIDAIAAAAIDHARSVGARRIVFSGLPAAGGHSADPAIDAAFRSAGFTITPWATSLVDLSRPLDDIEASFHRSVRKAVRRCTEAGCTVHECETFDEFRTDFWPAFVASRAARGESPLPDHSVMWERGHGTLHRFFVCRAQSGAVLATLATSTLNGVATELMSGRVPHHPDSALPVQDLLHGEVVRRHREAGDVVFDLAGYNPAAADGKEVGIRRFKTKWGGQHVDVHRYEWTDPAAWEPVVRGARSLSQRAASRGRRRHSDGDPTVERADP